MSTPKPVEVPTIGAPVADTHAHLDMLEDPAQALARAALAGVSFVVTVVDPTEDPERTFDDLAAWQARAAELIRSAQPVAEPASTPATAPTVKPGSPPEPPDPPDVRIIIGAHPHNAKDFGRGAAEQLPAFAGHPLVAGIGEIGLDYHYDHSPREVQRAAFAEQLDIAARVGLPAVVHLREAHDDGEAILREAGLPVAGCVLHCFTGDTGLLGRFLDLGCYVSFAGPVTFKNADAIREAAAQVPLDRLLVETDCPFMTPEPYRGRPNEPAFAVLTARRVAEVRGMPEDEFARATYENSRRLFGEPRQPSRPHLLGQPLQ